MAGRGARTAKDRGRSRSLGESLPRRVLDSLLEGCQVIGRDWTYLYVNDAVSRQGRRTKEELLGRTMMEVYPGFEDTPTFAVLRDCMERRIHRSMENEFTFPDGSSGWFELRIEPVPEGLVVFSLDVTDRKKAAIERERLEEQFRQGQKMEAIGRLAGGVAHDFNNLLLVILAYADLAVDAIRENEPLQHDLREIRKAAETAASLTEQLLAFSRKQVLDPKVLDLNAVVGGMEEILRRLVGEDVEIATRLSSDLGVVLADPTQMEQVLLNLAANAREAMPEGGRLTIETANVELDEAYARSHATVTPGPHVLLAVSDTGVGMDEETVQRLFEPFFTTRAPRHGTGLGLATVYGIVNQSGGHITVSSERGTGTAFKIYLPRQRGTAPSPVPERRITPRGGDETILVVEDHAAVRVLIERILTDAGYTVLAVGGAREALSVSERREEPLHLLLTDMVMPEMGGQELARRLGEARPGVRVLFMSGYAEGAVATNGELESGGCFIGKPFTASLLMARVREVLDAG